MAPSKAPDAEPGVRTANEQDVRFRMDVPASDNSQKVLLLGKRSTVRALAEMLADDGSTPKGRPDVALEAVLGTQGRLHLTVVTSQRAALQKLRIEPQSAIFVEVDNRPQSRVRFCRQLRNRVPGMAIIAVGDARPTGPFSFDAFVSKPLSTESIESAAGSLDDQSAPSSAACGPFELNLVTRTVETPDGSRHLTPKLCALLEYFIHHCGDVVSRSEIMEEVWQTTYLADTRTLDVHVRWLRESIESDPSNPQYLLTERGKGYVFRCC
jgi:DNA-binding response OmpR family regulator